MLQVSTPQWFFHFGKQMWRFCSGSFTSLMLVSSALMLCSAAQQSSPWNFGTRLSSHDAQHWNGATVLKLYSSGSSCQAHDKTKNNSCTFPTGCIVPRGAEGNVTGESNLFYVFFSSSFSRRFWSQWKGSVWKELPHFYAKVKNPESLFAWPGLFCWGISVCQIVFHSCFECCTSIVSAASPGRFVTGSEVSHEVAFLFPCNLESWNIPGKDLTWVPELEGSPCAHCHHHWIWNTILKCLSLYLQRLTYPCPR